MRIRMYSLCPLLVVILIMNIGKGYAMEEVLMKLDNGDTIKRVDDTVVLDFAGRRDVLASSVYNGGWRSDLQAVLNHHPQPQEEVMSLDDYLTNMRKLCCSLGYDPERVATMGTGVAMKDVSVQAETYDDLQVVVVATAGAEGNPGRVGDPASYSGKDDKLAPPGTINIMVYLNADAMPGVLARAIVTATEAKTAALQELLLGSMYSQGLATGTGTDQIIVISNPQGRYMVNDCGKHTKVGELVGRLVKAAVKEALYKRNGFDGTKMHAITRRMRRFGMTREQLQQDYCKVYGKQVDSNNLLAGMNRLDSDSRTVALTSLYAHLLDQYSWQLLSAEEVEQNGSLLLAQLAGHRLAEPPQGRSVNDFVKRWELAYLARLQQSLR